MSGAIIVRWVIRRSTEYRKPWLIVVFSSTKKKRKRCTLAWTFPGHKSAKEIDKFRQTCFSYRQKIYGDFHQAVSIPKVTKRIVNWNGAHRPCIKV
jgi:hypothetical protein